MLPAPTIDLCTALNIFWYSWHWIKTVLSNWISFEPLDHPMPGPRGPPSSSFHQTFISNFQWVPTFLSRKGSMPQGVGRQHAEISSQFMSYFLSQKIIFSLPSGFLWPLFTQLFFFLFFFLFLHRGSFIPHLFEWLPRSGIKFPVHPSSCFLSKRFRNLAACFCPHY